jgi:multiple sugar transport system permease protein
MAPLESFFNSRRGEILRENLTAYLFLAPAGLIIFVFGIFPVAFAFFVSLHEWGRFPEEYTGLAQYEAALGDFAYVLFFWMALGFIAYGLYSLWTMFRENRATPASFLMMVPGAAITAAIVALLNWLFVALIFIMNVPVRLRGQATTQGLFIQEFFNSFTFPEVTAAADILWPVAIAAVILTVIFFALIKTYTKSNVLMRSTLAFLMLTAGGLLMTLTYNAVQVAINTARESGESLPVWSQVIFIGAGVALLVAAFKVWQQAHKADDNRRFVILLFTAVLLVIGGYFLVTEIPRALAEADEDILNGFNVTVMYTLGTVPLQLIIGLGLAMLLFQNIRWKSFFRVVYFLPYITPFVATSAVFSLIFSHRPDSPINQLINSIGIQDQTWLQQPRGIFQLIFGNGIPSWLVGPSLALIVIILYNTWVYAGYSTVIFLAGLGNISKETYEAAKIDGANQWQTFRFITLPLLSPTTFFLVLIATIGTFQAFTQIFLLRKPGALEGVDTINIYILEEIRAARPDYAYGSAMAFVLFAVILILTIVQNRYAQRRVFYG